MNDFSIRCATEGDLSLILNFIHQLADYEKLRNEVVATEEELRKHLFECPKAEVLIGEYKSQPVAFALFFHNFSTFLGKPGIYLEDLFVNPEWRGKGFGKEILAYLAKLAVERNCGRFEWSCLSWNEPAINFYENLGAIPMVEWKVFRLTGKALENLANECDYVGMP
ncbi:MAG: GNAT family N-acetyltransferase [Marinifilaceae bacterium]